LPIGITLAGFAIALVLGLVLAILRRSAIAPVSRVTGFFVEFMRSTPLLIQVYVLFYVAPLYGLTMSALSAGTIGIAVHYACYVSEVYRAGLNGVACGQWEAACALSLSPWRTFRYLEPITMTGLFFLLISVTFASGIRHLQHRVRLP
jgi:polar amino acid transport system permease protein